MEQRLSGAPVATPAVDATGGQGAGAVQGQGVDQGVRAPEGGGEPQPGQFAGFNTPEELAADYQSKMTQLKNLESLKGRHGNEIGQLRQQVAMMSGQIEAFKTMQPAAPQGPTIDDIALKLQNGDIDEAQAIKMAYQLATTDAETRLGKQLQNTLKTEIGKIQQQTAQEKYVATFLGENPGYKEAYDGGKLDTWLQSGMSGEEAWTHYQLQATKAELDTLKKQSDAARIAAENSGINRGIKIEQGKLAAGKVLSGQGGGQFAAAGGKYNLNDPNQRRQAGIDRLKQLRGGT
ncbi:MAG TPA: hypothetical protein DDY86_09340 [Syntrophaceae bacterium]|nr:hypothetical protein [Syntrophaceae bacterium]